MNILNKVKKNIEVNGLCFRGDTVLVAVSGGPDSVSLLHILNLLRHDLGIHLHVAHFDHGLRTNSRLDLEFVKKLTLCLNIPCSTAHAPKTHLNKQRGSIEEKAREQRLAFLQELAKKIPAQSVALGHNEDDLAETVLMRIIRGTGLKGIRAILPKRLINRIPFIRPLLNISRSKIEDFLKKKNISFRNDPTNKQLKYFRNKIRWRLLPLLKKEYNTNINTVLAGLSENIFLDYEFLEIQAQKIFKKNAIFFKKDWISFKTSIIKKQHPAMLHMLIRLAIEQIKGNTRRLTFSHIKLLEELIHRHPIGSMIHLPQSLCIEKRKTDILLSVINGY